MYFTKNISTFIVGALLATSALGELTKVPRRAAADIVARQHVKTVRGMTAQEKLRKRDDECLDAINKRQLSRRANKEVSIGEYETGHGDDTIHTTSLASCFGVAVVGNFEAKDGDDGDDDRDDRFLSHSLEGESDNAEEMLGKAADAIDDGLKDVAITFVYPDPKAYSDDRGFTDDDREAVQDEIDYYNQNFGYYCPGASVDSKSHDYMEIWGIKINSDKSVNAGAGI